MSKHPETQHNVISVINRLLVTVYSMEQKGNFWMRDIGHNLYL